MSITFSADILSTSVFVFLAIFARVGAMIMVLPGFDSTSVPPRIRLLIALALSYVLWPLVENGFPAPPDTSLGIAFYIIWEIFIGLAVGLTVRVFFSALQVAGMLIAFQSGLAFAQNFDPTQDAQGVITGSFLSVLAVTLLFVTDMHHMMIAAAQDSYTLFHPSHALPVASFSAFMVEAVSRSFLVGLQMAMPVMAAGFIVYVATGVLAKLIPQVQVFFVVMPANILIGFAVMTLVLSTMMIWFMDQFSQHLQQFLN